MESLLERAASYPEEGRAGRIMRFHAQLDGMRWFLGEGAKRGDAFTMHWAAANLVLFGCRMLLAHNRVLFPCTKSMTHELKRCAELPEGIFEKMDALLKNPGADTAEAFYRGIKDWREWEQSPGGWSNLYMADTELRWLKGEAPVSDI